MNCKNSKIESIVSRSALKTEGNTYIWIERGYEARETADLSLLGKCKSFLKRHCHSHYNCLLKVFSPVMPSFKAAKKLQNYLKKYGNDKVILNVGSGPQLISGRNDIITLDLFAFDSVDMVCDATDLPLKDNSVDFVINIGCLEHTESPEVIAEEIRRVLKTGGELYCYLPFLVPFHGAPSDYHRWTKPGIELFFSNFSSVDIQIGGGPTSAYLWVAIEWLSILCSFGIASLKNILFIVLMLMTFPLKVLDILLVFHPEAEKLASGFYIYAKK